MDDESARPELNPRAASEKPQGNPRSDRVNTSDSLDSSNDVLLSVRNDYEAEGEADVREHQPTEATDETDLSTQIQTEPAETTVHIPYLPQPSRDRDDICSPSHEVEPASEERFSTLDLLCDAKAIDSSTVVCSESFCIPYTDEQDEISIIKQTTTVLTEEYKDIKKEKGDLEHIMISYNHSTRSMCLRIAKELKNLNYLVWIDQDNISGDILTSMASAVENAFVVLMAINDQYYQSRYCRLEAEYSVERNKRSVPMLMQTGYKAGGWLGLINGSKFHVDFSTMPFPEAFALLRREIEAIRRELGSGQYEQSTISTSVQSFTTISTFNQQKGVHDWNSDDVIDWLHREKLELLETPLTCFTGETLWQLYKIKLDSAPDYYRTVDTLLPPAAPLRLFSTLSFHAALESLFSPMNSKWQR